MQDDAGPSPEGEDTGRTPARVTTWRVLTPVVVLLSGLLFAVSAANSEGTDLRPGRYTDLASLVRQENSDYQGLERRIQALNGDVQQLTNQVDTKEIRRWRQRVAVLRDPAGLVARRGPGVVVTLSDAPADVINATTQDLNLLVVHQQDIQAVVNAMWSGGATAVTIQGQRVISTTGIKCEGNSVLLQGQPYAQPYVIRAIGPVDELSQSLADNSYLDAYRRDAARPDISVGWDLEIDDDIEAPAYDGLLSMTYARPLSTS
jgi:uncharacterized protein YlxW (UPF0749 family)